MVWLVETAKDIKNIFHGHSFAEALNNFSLYRKNKKNKGIKKITFPYDIVSYSQLFYYSIFEKFLEGEKDVFTRYVDFRNYNMYDLRRDFWVGRYNWGDYNEKVPYQKASSYAVHLHSERGLGVGVLDLASLNKNYNYVNEKQAIFHYGMVMSNLSMGHGFYFFEVERLPEVPGFFPALWVVSKTAWPPELDIIEQRVIPDKQGGLYTFIEHNIFYDNEENLKSVGSVSGKCEKINDKYYFAGFIDKHEIAVYYGYDLVRVTNEEEIVSHFRRPHGDFEIIINNAVLENQMHLAFRNIRENIEKTRMYVTRFAYWSFESDQPE